MRTVLALLVTLTTFGLDTAIDHVPGSVETDCGTVDTCATITYKGDPYAVLAVNEAGNSCQFEENIAEATFSVKIYYSNTGNDNDCTFDKRQGIELYSIKVQSRMVYRDLESAMDEKFIVECNFEPYSKNRVNNVGISDGFRSPKVVMEENGVPAASNFTVGLVRIDGEPLTGEVIIGRWVKLKTAMSPAVGERDNTVNNCFAYPENQPNGVDKVTILAQGCGTGILFSADSGFVKEDGNPLVAFSPIFRTFRMKGDMSVSFSCDFIICNSTTCGQSSCDKENEILAGNPVRMRRSVISGVHYRGETGVWRSQRRSRQVNETTIQGKVRVQKVITAKTQPVMVSVTFEEELGGNDTGLIIENKGLVELVKSTRLSHSDLERRGNQKPSPANTGDIVEKDPKFSLDRNTSSQPKGTTENILERRNRERKNAGDDEGEGFDSSNTLVVVAITVSVTSTVTLILSLVSAYCLVKHLTRRMCMNYSINSA